MEDLLGRFAAEGLVNETGEIYAEAGDEITEEVLAGHREAGSTR
jgi:DNA-directed RNA polymerase subunit beta